MSNLYERIKEVRNDSGFNQEKFGNRIGLSKSSVSWVEKGKQGISNNVIRNIATEFCINELWLKEGIGEKYDDKKILTNEIDFTKNLIRDDLLELNKKLASAVPEDYITISISGNTSHFK